jgi:hypothetical protein
MSKMKAAFESGASHFTLHGQKHVLLAKSSAIWAFPEQRKCRKFGHFLASVPAFLGWAIGFRELFRVLGLRVRVYCVGFRAEGVGFWRLVWAFSQEHFIGNLGVFSGIAEKNFAGAPLAECAHASQELIADTRCAFNPGFVTVNPKPETLNPKPQTLNPKP